MTTRLFVYGTLAPGCEAWSVLAPWATGTPREDTVAGVLYDTGRGYRAAAGMPARRRRPLGSGLTGPAT